MKKITALLLSLTMIVSLSACGEKKEETASNAQTTVVITTTSTAVKETTTESEDYKLNYVNTMFDIKFSTHYKWEKEKTDEDNRSWYFSDGSYIAVSCTNADNDEVSQKEIDNITASTLANNKILSSKISNIIHNIPTITIHSKYNSIKNITYAFIVNKRLYIINSLVSFDGKDTSANQQLEKVLDSIEISDNYLPSTNETQTTTATTTTAKETTVTTTTTEAITEKVPVYQSNMYKVGTDIDAGEYMLFAEDYIGGYVCVSSDANQDDIIYNDNFGNNLIATFEDGEYVDLSRCFAIPYDKVTADISELIKDYIDEGAMYKVGTNLEAGEYKLEATDDYGGYYCIYSDSRHDDIISNDNFDNNTYVSVSDGEYLLLSRCKIIE